MIKQQYTSVLEMLVDVEQMNQLDPNVYQYGITHAVASNRYNGGLHAVLLERKNFIREQMKTFTDPMREEQRQAARLTTPECNLSEDDQRDEEVANEVICYNANLDRIKLALSLAVDEMHQGVNHCREQMEATLREQLMTRPIDQTDINSSTNVVDQKFADCTHRLYEIAQNSILTQWKKVDDSKKRRRNFPREAIKILQDYFNVNKYPSENDKARLAEECEISVQQVSNWFGNKRIRDKRNEQLQEILRETAFNQQYQPFDASQQLSQPGTSGYFDGQPLSDGTQFSSIYGTSLNSIDYS